MSDEKKTPVQDSVDELRKVRDEIRVQLHLAGMEAKAFWEGVEPTLAAVEQKLERSVEATARYADVFVDELTKAFTRVRDRFSTDSDSDSDD